MRKKILLLLSSVFTSSLLFVSSVFAAEVSKFKVELSPNKAKVGESLDLTISALDKNGAVVTNYNGTILIFSESNPEASLPIVLKDSTYKFKEEDQGVVKFENGVKFTKSGKQNISLIDYENDSLFGKAEVEISDSGAVGKSDIEIISPEDGLTIGSGNLKVSGSTLKNHKVKIILNGKDNFDITSNNNGIFEKDLEGLQKGENLIKAQVLDSDNNVLGETKEVRVKIETNGILIKSIKVLPEEVFVEGPYTVELITEAGLKEAKAVLNDSVIDLKEESPGIYKGNSFAPKNPGTYKVDVNLVNDLGHKLNELGVASLKVKELNSPLKPSTGTVSTGNFEEPKKAERDPLKITGLKLVELKTKSILTWDANPKAKSYNIYRKNSSGGKDFITKVNEPKFEVNIEGDKVKFDDFYVSANGIDEDGLYEGILSDPTRIKTGPEMIIVLFIALLVSGVFLFFKGRKKS